ncbi:hypothetical protein [Thalassobellus suaedae]|uniref:Uncharacterized protein n=1 Tax=Thalassobellus suaedae TaxID=3074124 RepID=A0ABY9XW17_9FLAO|nr:hypothetical protein RHP51_05030 [Flavobacteriaceae bacterium HL-DH14]
MAMTTDQKELIEKLASKGIPDGDIAESLGLTTGAVGNITTKYWVKKMDEKDE